MIRTPQRQLQLQDGGFREDTAAGAWRAPVSATIIRSQQPSTSTGAEHEWSQQREAYGDEQEGQALPDAEDKRHLIRTPPSPPPDPYSHRTRGVCVLEQVLTRMVG